MLGIKLTRKHENLIFMLITSGALCAFLVFFQWHGYFAPFDAHIYGKNCGDIPSIPNPAALIAILLFSFLPCLGLSEAYAMGRAQAVLLGTVFSFFGYACLGFFYALASSDTIPLVAPALAGTISLLRGFGYHPALDLANSFRDGTFISYRRRDLETAQLLRKALQSRGIYAYLDVTGLHAGAFPPQLFGTIDKEPNLLVILSPGALDDCLNENDWVRKELVYAMKRDKNIVPVLKDGFTFPAPDTLPDDLKGLPEYQAVKYSVEDLDEKIGIIVQYLEQKRCTNIQY